MRELIVGRKTPKFASGLRQSGAGILTCVFTYKFWVVFSCVFACKVLLEGRKRTFRVGGVQIAVWPSALSLVFLRATCFLRFENGRFASEVYQ